MHKCLQYLKVNGVFVNKGDSVDLSILSKGEIGRLEKKGIVEPADEKVAIKNNVDSANSKGKEDESLEDVEMTYEEVRAELLEKITHSVAVKELTLLGADFKKNASLPTLVDIILSKEEYENHFFNYIDTHGL